LYSKRICGVSQYALFNLMWEMVSRIEITLKGSIGMYVGVINVDTNPDTKRSVQSVRDAFHVKENLIKSIQVRLGGSALTPETRVRSPLGPPVKITRGYVDLRAPFSFVNFNESRDPPPSMKMTPSFERGIEGDYLHDFQNIIRCGKELGGIFNKHCKEGPE
jgi:hypothetical protein